jgi:hypothetical protein
LWAHIKAIGLDDERRVRRRSISHRGAIWRAGVAIPERVDRPGSLGTMSLDRQSRRCAQHRARQMLSMPRQALPTVAGGCMLPLATTEKAELAVMLPANR